MEFIGAILEQQKFPDCLRDLNILDWGCGIGALVAAFQSAGYSVTGYDSDPLAVELGKKLWKCNIQIIPPNMDNLHDSFGLLCMSHVLEHFADIIKTIKDCLKWLMPGGFFFVEVPQCNAKMLTMNLDTESHLHFFTETSLRFLMAELQLEVLRCVSCGPPKFANPGFKKKVLGVVHKTMIPFFPDRWLKILRRVRKFRRHPLKTEYDCYYDKYYKAKEEKGIWLRCLTRKPL